MGSAPYFFAYYYVDADEKNKKNAVYNTWTKTAWNSSLKNKALRGMQPCKKHPFIVKESLKRSA